MGNDQGGYKDCFRLWTGQLHRVIHGLIHQPNLKWAEGRRREDVVDRAHLPLFGTQRGQGDWSFSVHGVPTGPVRCTRAASGAAFDTAAGSDVHLKLSLIPNCVLPVVIVQVFQVVHFYFGVFH